MEHATSFLYYAKGGNVRQLLYELKYHGNQEVGEVMGRMMASELMCSHFFDGIDLIVPVPLHQRKKRLRGYNQSECLARGVSVVTGIPMNTKVVIRSRYTDTQTHKGQYARWENVDYVSVYLLWHWQGNLDNNNYFLEKYLVRFFIISMYFYIFAQYLSDIVEL